MIAFAFVGLLVVLFVVACALAIVIGVGRERPYQCEVCGGFFTERDAVFLTEEWPEADGGTAMTATFCKAHVPKEVA